MKIGILTFHSQLNYGGVLQCWALQNALEKMGHEVVVIDRWFDKENSQLEGNYKKWGWKQWLIFGIQSLLGLGNLNGWLRVTRTKRFIRKYLNLTSYHFVEWKEAPKELGVDMLVIGSDQVLHCGDFGDPRVYLLDSAPKISSIAYAVSFGMDSLPKFLREDNSELAFIETKSIYKQGLTKFKAISCREIEGIEICRSLGFYATYVVDPTLLDIQPKKNDCCQGNDLVCYFLSEGFEKHFAALEQFAQRYHCHVKVFIDNKWILPMPTDGMKMKKWIHGIRKRCFSHVKVMDGAGPEEFYKAFQNAKWVISDSFHALMFSIRNNCNARIIRPTTDLRRRMFARIEEFANHTRGPLIVESVMEALDSLSNNEIVMYDYRWIYNRRKESIEWLKKNLV